MVVMEEGEGEGSDKFAGVSGCNEEEKERQMAAGRVAIMVATRAWEEEEEMGEHCDTRATEKRKKIRMKVSGEREEGCRLASKKMRKIKKIGKKRNG